MPNSLFNPEGNIPHFYERGLVPVMFSEPAARMARLLAAHRPQNLLETAAGTGIATRAVLELGQPVANYTVTDFNQAALDIARETIGTARGLRFQTADAMDLPFPTGHFDMLLCQFGIMLFPDKEKAYLEARRVLGLGGHFLFSVWDAHARNPFAAVLTREIERFFETDSPRFFDTPYGYNSIDVIRAALQENGFGDIHAHVVRARVAIGDPQRFAEGFVFGTQFREQIKARGADARALRDRIANAFDKELKGETALQYILLEATAI